MIKRIAEIVKASPPETSYRNKLSRIYLHPAFHGKRQLIYGEPASNVNFRLTFDDRGYLLKHAPRYVKCDYFFIRATFSDRRRNFCDASRFESFHLYGVYHTYQSCQLVLSFQKCSKLLFLKCNYSNSLRVFFIID